MCYAVEAPDNGDSSWPYSIASADQVAPLTHAQGLPAYNMLLLRLRLRHRKSVSIAGLYQPISQWAVASHWRRPAHWPTEQEGCAPTGRLSSHEHRHQAGKY